jgi:hypothetical protein
MTTKIDLVNLTWPVYRVGETEPFVDKGVTSFLTKMEDEDGTVTYREHVVDDKNLPGPTLSARRIKMLGQNRNMFQLKRALFFIGDLLKTAKSTTWFIDSAGLLFNHKKSRMVPLEYLRIERITPLAAGGAIIEVRGTITRFKVMLAPEPGATHVGVLRPGPSQYLLYGVYNEAYKNTRRMI